MARYMLVCRSVENNPNKLILDKIGFVRYFATADEAWHRAIKWRNMKLSDGAVEVFAQERCWL